MDSNGNTRAILLQYSRDTTEQASLKPQLLPREERGERQMPSKLTLKGGVKCMAATHMSGREGSFRERVRNSKILVGKPKVLRKVCLEKR